MGSNYITIRLTGRPPVSINQDKWEKIAYAHERTYDSQYAWQANVTVDWCLTVRRHGDGRSLVYAIYDYSPTCRRSLSAYAGELLPAGSSMEDICNAINRVANAVANGEHDGDDARRWPELARQCIASLPAEDLD